MTILDAVILGIVQGLTEFLPISSSGHLILAREVLGLDLAGSLAFDAVLQFATALAIVAYFRRDVMQLLRTVAQLTTRSAELTDRLTLYGLIVATIPAVLLGLLLEEFMDTLFRDGMIVAISLLVGSFIMFVAESWWRRASFLLGPPSMRIAFTIGLFQCLALIPGMSRSGMTIAGGMIMGLDREQAARFAFLLAIPILLGSGLKKMFDLGLLGLIEEGSTILAGSLAAFAVGIVVIHFLLAYLRKHTLMPFIIYRVVLAIGVFFTLFLA